MRGVLKNEHMKSTLTGVHPAPMVKWGFHVAIKKQQPTGCALKMNT